MRHKTVDVDLGGPVHYIDFGGSDRPVLMVHGLGGSALNWMAVAPALAQRRHVMAIDLAGFGRTPLFKRSAALGANQALVDDFIKNVIGEPVTLIGNSMGGHISILEAAAYPERVAAMVLVDPAIPGVHLSRPEPALLGYAAALSVPGLAELVIDRRLRDVSPESLVARTLAMVCVDPTRIQPDVLAAHVQLTRERASLGRQNGRALLQATRSLGIRMADPRFWAHVKNVQAPTLVIHGELDRLIPIAAAHDLVRRRRDWTLEVMDGVGHVPMLETPELFLGVLEHWMADLTAPAPTTVS